MANDILREVEDELRQEQLSKFAKQWGPWLIGAVAAGVLAYGGWMLWQDRQASDAREAAASYEQALQSLQAGQLDEGAARLEALAKSAPGDLGALAAIQRAGTLV